MLSMALRCAMKKKKNNLFVKFTTITIATGKKDTLTGCKGGYTPINVGRL